MFKARFLKTLRILHGWLGIFVLPWVIVIGLTGFYLNHARTIISYLETPSYDESSFDLWPNPEPVTLESALGVSMKYWPDEIVLSVERVTYHNRLAYAIKKDSGQVIVTEPSGHYFVKTRFRRQTFNPNGELIHSKTYWSSIFKTLHARGWLTSTLGTWLADITSIAMVVFGVTGIFMWWMPRSKRYLRFLGLKRRN